MSDLVTYPWQDCATALAPWRGDASCELEAKGRFFLAEEKRIWPPWVFPIPRDCRSVADYLDTLPTRPGRQLLVLMQAGAVALGLFEGGEQVATKCFRRYVVRGKGRAQPTHLRAKGKSRYGSRLRLQNALRLFEETVEKLREWEQDHGPAATVFYNAPVRLWSSFLANRPAPPFEKGDSLVRVPLDLSRPSADLLGRTYRWMCYGRIETLEDSRAQGGNLLP